jgi:hypothetical protein
MIVIVVGHRLLIESKERQRRENKHNKPIAA